VSLMAGADKRQGGLRTLLKACSLRGKRERGEENFVPATTGAF
jgi:hypothetical protein